MNRTLTITPALLMACTAALASPSAATQAAGSSALSRMPVKEVTVFKDGHAFVVHQGQVPTNAAGEVVLDYVPAPVLGTFWPFTPEGEPRLVSVTAAKQPVNVERTALTVRELLEANPGAEVVITETGGQHYPATILSIPLRTSKEFRETSPPNSDPRLPEKANIVLLRTHEGIKAMPLERIQDVTFKSSPRSTAGSAEFRNTLTLRLDSKGKPPAKTAEVGLAYLQKGLRWIPEYKVVIDGQGSAAILLQATLINELVDLDDVNMHLVIGVPTFAFKDTQDPISFQQVLAQVSQAQDRRFNNFFNLSNSIMSQQVAAMPALPPAAEQPSGAADLGPEVAGSDKREDLFVFTVQHVTLRKGQRMVLPVAEFTLKYQDVFALDVPFAPPPEVRGNFNSEQQAQLARLYASPKVMHRIRLVNSSKYPLTTAPALIFKGQSVLSQGMMTYAAPGASADIDMATAVDIQVRKTDRETKRTPNAAQWEGNQYARVDLEGSISLVSRRKDPVEVEVIRRVLGNIESADRGGEIEALNVFEEARYMGTGEESWWWTWYSWPYWWNHFNGIGRVTWRVTLKPDERVDLGYKWNYYWR